MPVLARPTDRHQSQRQKDLIPNIAHIGVSEEERRERTSDHHDDDLLVGLLCLCCTETKKTHPPVQPKRRPFLFGIAWSRSYLSPLCSLYSRCIGPYCKRAVMANGKVRVNKNYWYSNDDDETIAAFVYVSCCCFAVRIRPVSCDVVCLVTLLCTALYV